MQSPAKYAHILASDNLLILMKTFARAHKLGMVTHEKALVSLFVYLTLVYTLAAVANWRGLGS